MWSTAKIFLWEAPSPRNLSSPQKRSKFIRLFGIAATAKKQMQDGKTLKLYRKRWLIEQNSAWLGDYPRLLLRHERRNDLERILFHLAYATIALRRF